MRRPGLLYCGIMLTLTLACGGGGGGQGAAASAGPTLPATPATALMYTSPTDATAWRLTLDAATTPTLLILDLMAPTGTSGQGITLILDANASLATWHAFSPGVYLQGLAFPSPLVNVASVQGSALRIVAAQAPGTPVDYGSAPVLQVALEIAGGAVQGNASLTATAGGHLGASAPPVSIQVEAGNLVAQ